MDSELVEHFPAESLTCQARPNLLWRHLLWWDKLVVKEPFVNIQIFLFAFLSLNKIIYQLEVILWNWMLTLRCWPCCYPCTDGRSLSSHSVWSAAWSTDAALCCWPQHYGGKVGVKCIFQGQFYGRLGGGKYNCHLISKFRLPPLVQDLKWKPLKLLID